MTGKKPKYLRNSGQPITSSLIVQVRKLAKGNTPTRVIGLLTGRSEASIRAIATQNKISLTPPNQRPYNRRKK